jgi:hypothetical protein
MMIIQTLKPSKKQTWSGLTWPNWWAEMITEFDNMHSKQVWTIIPRNSIPGYRKIVGNRWVYAQKDDGRFRARTVAKGFTQIHGKGFQENHSPL